MKVQFSTLALSILLLSGCVNFNQAPGTASYNVNGFGSMGATTITTSGSTASYTCPSSANVVPNYDWLDNGTNQFTVCMKSDGSKDYWVYGQSDNGGQVCIIPVDDTAGTSGGTNITGILPYQDPNVTSPANPWNVILSHCSQPSSTGFEANFGSIAYNAFFIVDQKDLDTMEECLYQQDYNLCPKQFSYGTVPATPSP